MPEERAILVAEVQVELQDQVVELVLVEVVGQEHIVGGIARTRRSRASAGRYLLTASAIGSSRFAGMILPGERLPRRDELPVASYGA